MILCKLQSHGAIACRAYGADRRCACALADAKAVQPTNQVPKDWQQAAHTTGSTQPRKSIAVGRGKKFVAVELGNLRLGVHIGQQFEGDVELGNALADASSLSDQLLCL